MHRKRWKWRNHQMFAWLIIMTNSIDLDAKDVKRNFSQVIHYYLGFRFLFLWENCRLNNHHWFWKDFCLLLPNRKKGCLILLLHWNFWNFAIMAIEKNLYCQRSFSPSSGNCCNNHNDDQNNEPRFYRGFAGNINPGNFTLFSRIIFK